MFSRQYWTDLAERTIAAFAAGVLIPLGSDAVNLWTVDLKQALGYGLGAALFAIVTGLGARKVGNPDSAGFLR